MRRSVPTLFVLLLIAALALTACGGAAPAAPAPPAATEAPAAAEAPAATEAPAAAEAPATGSDGPFKIAFVLPSPVTDLAWGQAMYDALQTVQKEMGEDKLEIGRAHV